MPAAPLRAPDEDRSHHSDRGNGANPAMAAPGAQAAQWGAAIADAPAANAANAAATANAAALHRNNNAAGDNDNDDLFAAVDIAEDEPHPEGTVARALAQTAAPAAAPDQPPLTAARAARAALGRRASS